ncbi:hypothetical protein D8M04_06865 [Oceanobacillus piezotolerans]|uniref:Uncharacterized protein n=1 Tax=Oceanobacillus piezotolerans TaxID=2448030 RepID=A0A498DKA3_9BACI|nr:abortive infection system antitoxin AbiGi family protein [Oceanobacillus piezotolerans]RLL46912.1 hypothetical protein D8M04_06865 [Oceanobacillus piezotolerans]
MELVQRYVSRELTHFVGRHLLESERFDLLIEIIKSGRLLHKHQEEPIQINIDAEGLEEIVNPAITCFADIPINDLSLHMEKYSNFGLAFKKEFLVKNGANPVLYIASNGMVESSFYKQDIVNREHFFKKSMKEYFETMDEIRAYLVKKEGSKAMLHAIEDLDSFFKRHFFAYLKPFDASRKDADEDNYYMEREWRIVGELKFTLEDVTRILVPEKYGKKIREVLPAYFGQISFTE